MLFIQLRYGEFTFALFEAATLAVPYVLLVAAILMSASHGHAARSARREGETMKASVYGSIALAYAINAMSLLVAISIK